MKVFVYKSKVLMLICVSIAFTFYLSPLTLKAQEVLLPLQTAPSIQVLKSSSNQALTLPFFEDFSHTTFHLSPLTFHLSGGATVESGARLMPPTVGVATLDALDADGELYSHAVQSVFSADTLMSLPLRLDSLQPADSVVMSFYYLPGGGYGNLWERVGYTPGAEDSLFLDFYRAVDSTWVTVWGRGGVEVDSLVAQTGRDWQYVAIAVDDASFFDSTFRFRFRNRASLADNTKPGMSGNCDYWHIDYIFVDRGRSVALTPVFRDVAFVNPAPSLLKAYRAMPARHYRVTDMADSLSMTVTNLFNSPLATHYRFAVIDGDGDTLHRYDGGFENAPPFLPGGSYQTAAAHARPAVGYAFPTMTEPTEYTIEHIVREGVGGDDYQRNDTVRYRQLFDNYYAYDDGSAENGYGITSTASRIFLAYRFNLNTEDTLTALDICFNRTRNGENEEVTFYLTVWDVSDGHPGSVLYRDAESRRVEVEGLNRFHRYRLEAQVIVRDSIFVGFEQTDNDYINLGFDRSFNSCDRIYYLTGTEWQQSILSGSLMLRPCFGASALVGIEELSAESGVWKVYPNPASDVVNMEGLPEGSRIELYDYLGRQILSSFHFQFSTFAFPNGIYLLRAVTPQGRVFITKLIIRH